MIVFYRIFFFFQILGQTRQEFTHDGCTPTDLKYRPIKHIPLYMVNIGTFQLSLGIHLSSQLAMDTECPGNGIYQMEPLTDVRIGGEALGTVAVSFIQHLTSTKAVSNNICIAYFYYYYYLK